MNTENTPTFSPITCNTLKPQNHTNKRITIHTFPLPLTTASIITVIIIHQTTLKSKSQVHGINNNKNKHESNLTCPVASYPQNDLKIISKTTKSDTEIPQTQSPPNKH